MSAVNASIAVPAPQIATRARTKLAARRGRVRRIRMTVVAITLVVFLAVWGVIFAQLVAGHDPSLSAASRSSVTHSATAVSASSGSSSAGSISTASNSGSGSASAVTTKQS